MANNAFAFTGLTGGTAGMLDDLIHTNITDGDVAIVGKKSNSSAFLLVYDAANNNSTNPEATGGPSYVVVPDSNATGTGAWVGISLQSELIGGDPTAATDLYYNGIKAAFTSVEGFTVKDTSGTTPILRFANDASVTVGQIYSFSGSPTYLTESVVSKSHRFYGHDGAAIELLATFTQGSGCDLYYDGTKHFSTIDDGIEITVAGGCLTIPEVTTPTADANKGKVYCKADNKLYFQDGAGSEHEVSLAT